MNMYEIERAVKSYLDEEHLRYRHESGTHAFLLGFELNCGGLNHCMMAITAHDEEDLSCHVTYEKNVPEAALPRVVEYITRANYGLFLGNFQLDMNDGQIIYQIGAAHSDHSVTREEIGRMVHVAAGMAERYGEGFWEVISNDLTPEEAINRAECRASFSGLHGGDDETDDPAGGDDEADDPIDEECLGLLDEMIGSGVSDPVDDGCRELLTEMTDDRLNMLMEAITAEMGSRAGTVHSGRPIPEEYMELAADLGRMELLGLGLAVLDELSRRASGGEPGKAGEGSDGMSDGELLRRRASVELKEKLSEKLTG